jgi:hypothetical protein
MKTSSQQQTSMTRSISMIPQSTDQGWKVTGTDWSGDFTKYFKSFDEAKGFVCDFINDSAA